MSGISYVGQGTEGSATGGGNPQPVVPTCQVGDFLWVPFACSVSTIAATNALSGFTRQYGLQSNATAPSAAGFYKFATAGDIGATLTINSPGGSSLSQVFAYRGVDPLNPFDDGLYVSDGWSVARTNYDVPAQTTVTPHCCAIVHAWSNSLTGSFTPPTVDGGYTEIWDSGGGGAANIQTLAHIVDMGNPQTTSIRNIVRSGSVKGGVAGIVLRPAADAVSWTRTLTFG